VDAEPVKEARVVTPSEVDAVPTDEPPPPDLKPTVTEPAPGVVEELARRYQKATAPATRKKVLAEALEAHGLESVPIGSGWGKTTDEGMAAVPEEQVEAIKAKLELGPPVAEDVPRAGPSPPMTRPRARKKPDLVPGLKLKGRRLVADPDNLPAAREFVANLRREAEKLDKEAGAATKAKGRKLRQNARAARRDADRIERTITAAEDRKPKKTKPKEKPAKAKRLFKRELLEIQEARSARAKAADRTRLHSKVVPVTSPRTRTWARDQGTMDIQGIDTPKEVYRRGGVRIVEVHEPKVRERSHKPRATAKHKQRRSKPLELGAGIVETRTRRGRKRHLKLA